MRQKLVVRAVALALAFPAGIAVAGPTSQHKPDTLLAIDANRASVIEGIVYTWGPAFEQAANGMSSDALRSLLQKLRADQLLAASVAGSFAGIRDVLADAQPVSNKGMSAKALGDASPRRGLHPGDAVPSGGDPQRVCRGLSGRGPLRGR